MPVHVIGNQYRSVVTIIYGVSVQKVMLLQAYFGNTECSALS